MSQVVSSAPNATIRSTPVERVLQDHVLRATRRQGLIGHAAVAIGRALLIGAILGLWAYAAGRWIDHEAVSDPVAVLNALYHLIETGRLWPDLWQTVSAGRICFRQWLRSSRTLFAIFRRSNRPCVRSHCRLLILSGARPAHRHGSDWDRTENHPGRRFVFFIVFMNVVAGIESVNRNHVNIVRVMGRRFAVLRKIVPDRDTISLPRFAAGYPGSDDRGGDRRIHLRDRGLGFLVYSASNELNTAVSMAALVVLVFVVAIGDVLLGLVERLWLPRQLQQADPRTAR
jgi:NitT/TauT family transport system permease protein